MVTAYFGKTTSTSVTKIGAYFGDAFVPLAREHAQLADGRFRLVSQKWE